MTMHEPVIRDDPRAARVISLLHALSRHSAFLTTEQQQFEAVGDTLAEILDFDRLTILASPQDGEPPVTVFRRGSPRQAPIERDDLGPGFATESHGIPLAQEPGSVLTNAAFRYYDDRKAGCRQVMTCPVVVNGRRCGLIELELTTDDRHFSLNDLWIVETICHTSTLALALMSAGSSSETKAHAPRHALTDELFDLMVTGPTPAGVMQRIAQRVAVNGDCDVILMRREHGIWVGAEPVTRDASRTRSRRLLLDRLRNLQPPASDSEHAGPGSSESAMLAKLVAEVHDLVGEIPDRGEDSSASVFSLPPELGGPLLLVAFRSASESEDQVRHFTDEDRSAIWHTIQSFSPALLSATHADNANRTSAERDAILKAVRAIGAGQSTIDRIKIACRTVQLLLVADYVAISDWNTDPPTIRFATGGTASEPVTLVHKGTVGDVRRQDAPRIITDFPRVPPLDIASYPLHVAEELSASLTFRLQWSGRTFGSLIVGYRQPQHFPVTDRRLAESMAHVVVSSLGSELSGTAPM